MKEIALITLIFGFIACNQQSDNTIALQNRIDSLEHKLKNTYKPGFGDFMSSIQAHHYKLWFAGQYENWDLADFEVHEITETIEDLQEFHSDRKEGQLIDMIFPPLDSVSFAIKKENPELFKRSYDLLSTTCNDCHRATEVEFNVVKTPDSSPYGNQEFKPIK